MNGGCSIPVDEQVKELWAIRDGWLDGHGKAPTFAAMAKTSDVGSAAALLRLATPYLYPTEDGGVRVEWGDGDGGPEDMRIEADGSVLP